MIRLRSLFALGMALPSVGAFAQPRDLVLPRIGDAESSKTLKSSDPLANYGNNRREAALAAFQAGYKAATVERKRDRATRLMLIALRRDPSVDAALYDMGILCAQYLRWDDAIKFQQEAQQRAPPGSEVAKLAATELERLQAVARLEATPEGTKRRAYDIQFLAASSIKDPIKALLAAKALTERDATRWEGFALTGILSADSHDFLEGLKRLEAASGLAPAARREALQAAAGIARREVEFTSKIQEADGLWEKQQYEQAARAYSEAWESSPGRFDAGMRAVTGFLLADQVPLAVQILSLLRNYGQPGLEAKVKGMLGELGAISEEAKNKAAEPVRAATPLPGDSAERIRKEIGSLATPQMELAARPDPPLLDGTRPVIPVPDNDINSGQSDIGFLSTVSLFALYQRDAANDRAAAPAPDATMQATLPVPAPPAAPAGTPPVLPSLRSSERMKAPPVSESGSSKAAGPPPPGGPVQQVEVTSLPAGSTITFDEGDPALTPTTCIAPCQVALPPGRHTLLATLAGYHEARKILEVARKPQTLSVELKAKGGTIFVESTPAGLAVSLDGKSTGKTTPVDLFLTEGEYEISVEIGGSPVRQRVKIVDGAMLKLPFGKQ